MLSNVEVCIRDENTNGEYIKLIETFNTYVMLLYTYLLTFILGLKFKATLYVKRFKMLIFGSKST
jgi:hypothetical protein